MLAHPDAPGDLNPTALGLFVTPRIEQGTTPYENIFQLQGGHVLTWQGGAPIVRRWWTPDTAIRTTYRDPRDYLIQARELFDAAVAACSRSAGGISATLSGGLDSTLVAATAALQLHAHNGLLQTYTSIPEPGLACDSRAGWEIDDSPYVHDLAAMHENLRTSFVTPGGHCTLDILPAIYAGSRTPVRNGASLLWSSRICEASAAAGVRVILNGFKGNATLSQAGQGGIGDLLRRLRWSAALHAATTEAQQFDKPVWRVLAREIAGESGRKMHGAILGPAATAPLPGVQLLSPAFRAAHDDILATQAPPLTSRAALAGFAIKPTHGWGVDSVAQWGVELRDPTADRRLIERLLTFPPHAFLTDGRVRGLARAVGKDRLPDSIRLRTSKGEQTPELAAIVAAHAAAYREALAHAAEVPLFRETIQVERLKVIVDRLCAGNGSRQDADLADRALGAGLFMAAAV
jgi:asparagine synthase (glutamine-hydrolysing)